MKGIYPFLIVVAADKQNKAIIGFSGEMSGIWSWKTTIIKIVLSQYLPVK